MKTYVALLDDVISSSNEVAFNLIRRRAQFLASQILERPGEFSPDHHLSAFLRAAHKALPQYLALFDRVNLGFIPIEGEPNLFQVLEGDVEWIFTDRRNLRPVQRVGLLIGSTYIVDGYASRIITSSILTRSGGELSSIPKQGYIFQVGATDPESVASSFRETLAKLFQEVSGLRRHAPRGVRRAPTALRSLEAIDP